MTPGIPLEMRRPITPYQPNDYLMGLVSLPPWLRFKQSAFYAYSFEITPSTPPQQQQQITLEGDSFFLLEAINVVACNLTGGVVNPVKLSFSDTSRGLNWSPNSLVSPNISGRGNCTKFLSHPTLFKPSSSILYSANNNPDNVTLYGTLIGRKIFDLTPQEADFLLRRVWFQYDVLLGPLAAGASNYFPLPTANDSDFYLWKLYSAEAIQYSNGYAPLTISFRDATTNKNIFNTQAAAQTFLGQQYSLTTTAPGEGRTGKGFSLTIPRLIRKNSTFIIDVTNTDANGSDPVFGPANFTLEGVRVFS